MSGLDLDTLGIILMIVGGLGLIVSLIVLGMGRTRGGGTTVVRDRTPVQGGTTVVNGARN